MASPGIREEIDRRLARSGRRWTRGRTVVAQAMQGLTAPLSAAEIQAKVGPDVPLSSLYRIIADLVDAKVLIKLEFAEGFARFELDEGIAEHHHHLVCTGCGAVADLELADLEAVLDGATAAIANRSGFRVAAHRLDFFGLCAACSATSEPALPQR